MKIAYCFSGMIRHLDQCGTKWQEIIKNNPGDVYGHFWDKSDKCDGDTPKKFVQMFNPCNMELENYEIFKESTVDILTKNIVPHYTLLSDIQHSILSGNFFSFHYKIWKCNQLSLTKNYDIVIRCRTDWYPQTDLLLEKNEYINVPVGTVHVNGWPLSGGILDMFAYGNRKNMNYYSCLYLYAIKYLFEGHYCYPFEHILSVHLSQKDMQVRQLPISIINNSGFCYNHWAEKNELINKTDKIPQADKSYYAYTENRLL